MRPQYYKLDDTLWLSPDYFTESYSNTWPLRKLGVRRYEPLEITKIIDDNAVRLNFTPIVQAQNAVKIEQTTMEFVQPSDIAVDLPNKAIAYPEDFCQIFVEMENIWSHHKWRKRF